MRIRRQAPDPKNFVSQVLSAIRGGAYWKSVFAFEPRDIWVGIYWNAKDIEYEYAKDFVRSTYRWCVDVYVCPLPCFVIRFSIECGTPRWKLGDMSIFNRGRDETNRFLSRHQPLSLPADRSAMIERALSADENLTCKEPQ